MAGSDAQERTEEATPRKREQARKKGSVARSMDLNSSLVMLGLIMLFPAALVSLANGFLVSVHGAWSLIGSEPSVDNLGTAARSVLSASTPGLAMLMFCAMGIGLASNFAQVGFVINQEAMTPKLDRLNPLEGFKRLFSSAALVEGLKALGKSMIFAYAAYSVLQSNWAQLTTIAYLPAMVAFGVVGGLIKAMALRVGIVWLVVAALDTFYQRKKLSKDLRMSKEEIKQEMKEMEQSPELKIAIARRRRQLSKRMMSAVPKADVIVTNPTHYSIAIKYEQGKDHAPQVVAKGTDLVAFKIREIAKEHNVPIVPNPPLARALYRKCEVGDFVPRDYFVPVAEVLAFVYRTLKKVRAA